MSALHRKRLEKSLARYFAHGVGLKFQHMHGLMVCGCRAWEGAESDGATCVVRDVRYRHGEPDPGMGLILLRYSRITLSTRSGSYMEPCRLLRALASSVVAADYGRVENLHRVLGG